MSAVDHAVDELSGALDQADRDVLAALPDQPGLRARETGRVRAIGEAVAEVEGLPGVRAEELVRFAGGRLGVALDLAPDHVGVVLLDDAQGISAGDEARRERRVLDVPVGEGLLGRVIDPTGRPLDGRGRLRSSGRLPVQRPAPAIMDRDPVRRPLQTGITVIDALIPVGRGQRELIIGDRQTGKTAVAVDAILDQADTGVAAVYCAVGQRESSVAKVIAELREHGALERTTVVVAGGDAPVGLQYTAPYAATSIAEHLVARGRDVLVVYDDLTRHARAYRELSLLLRRPPGREAYPGDVFYLHARLLERATQLRAHLGGGSLTALPIVETQGEDLAAYIPTNLISITDGQILLSTRLFRRGQFPAVDVGRSVSRVGGKAQLPAYRGVAGELRLAYARFEELERFTRYGARLEESQRLQFERGRRVRAVLRQRQRQPRAVVEQLAELVAVTEGLLDDVEPDDVAEACARLHRVARDHGELRARIEGGEPLVGDDRARFVDILRRALADTGS
ncbi:MAG TPA: F0F1 ATP synthase subunit alpha [Acidimicrobiales bacterium]|nr:F0F1 ATP synthase subunit alpha [Acidimicrobiales bacterium]